MIPTPTAAGLAKGLFCKPCITAGMPNGPGFTPPALPAKLPIDPAPIAPPIVPIPPPIAPEEVLMGVPPIGPEPPPIGPPMEPGPPPIGPTPPMGPTPPTGPAPPPIFPKLLAIVLIPRLGVLIGGIPLALTPRPGLDIGGIAFEAGPGGPTFKAPPAPDRGFGVIAVGLLTGGCGVVGGIAGGGCCLALARITLALFTMVMITSFRS